MQDQLPPLSDAEIKALIADYLDGPEPDRRAAWGTWPQVLRLLDGQPVKLTSHELRVLSYLMHHRGRVVSQSELTEHIYAQTFDRDSNTVEVFIARLRRKLGGHREPDRGRRHRRPDRVRWLETR